LYTLINFEPDETAPEKEKEREKENEKEKGARENQKIERHREKQGRRKKRRDGPERRSRTVGAPDPPPTDIPVLASDRRASTSASVYEQSKPTETGLEQREKEKQEEAED
jgi:hypothetical protein